MSIRQESGVSIRQFVNGKEIGTATIFMGDLINNRTVVLFLLFSMTGMLMALVVSFLLSRKFLKKTGEGTVINKAA
jgi:Fe2+ transport system protein B